MPLNHAPGAWSSTFIASLELAKQGVRHWRRTIVSPPSRQLRGGGSADLTCPGARVLPARHVLVCFVRVLDVSRSRAASSMTALWAVGGIRSDWCRAERLKINVSI